MSESEENGASRRLVLTPAEIAGAATEAGDFSRLRRGFLRQAAMATLLIPGIGAVTQAADKKAKGGGSASADAKKVGGAKQAAAARRTEKLKAARAVSGKASGPSAASAKLSPGRTLASAQASGSHKPLAQHADQINQGSAPGDDTGATLAASRVNGGRALPEIYKDWNLDNFEQIQDDENAHVAFLVNALGSHARPTPIFQDLEQSTVHDFAVVARALENTGVGAYLGALPVLASTPEGQQYLAAAGSIALIESRHAGYLNALIDLSLDENIEGNVANFEMPLTPQQVVSLASPFIESLNGGPPLIPAGGFTNPLDLLNFALALEYLESAFYNINVPNFRRTLAK